MTVATLSPSTPSLEVCDFAISTVQVGDGTLVRLRGHLGKERVGELRAALLAGRPEGSDVLVDAGWVTGADDEAVAVLVAAKAWSVLTRTHLAYSAVSLPLAALAGTLGVEDALPMLPPPGARAE